MKWFFVVLNAWKNVWRYRTIAVVLWFIALILALPAYMTFQRGLQIAFDRTMVSEIWLRSFDFNYLLELMLKTPLIGASFAAVSGVWIVGFFVSILLTGGIVGLVRHEQALPIREFFRFGGMYYGRCFRIAIWALSFSTFGMMGLLGGPWGGAIGGVWILLAVAAGDIAKFRMASDDLRKTFPLYFSSWWFVVRNIVPVGGAYLFNGLILAAGFGFYYLLDNAFTPDALGKILLMFLIQQAFVFFRGFSKMAVLTTAYKLWQTYKPEPKPEPVAATPPTDASSEVAPAAA